MSKYNQLIVKGINNPNGKNVLEGEGVHLLLSNGEYVNGILFNTFDSFASIDIGGGILKFILYSDIEDIL